MTSVLLNSIDHCLFKQVIINRSKGLARFGLMHNVMSSLCFWIYAIINETLESIADKKFFYEAKYCPSDKDDDYDSYSLWQNYSRADPAPAVNETEGKIIYILKRDSSN